MLLLALFAALQDRMSCLVAMAMIIVFIGTVLSSIPVHGAHLVVFPDIETMLFYILGLGAVFCSGFSVAGRLIYQEIAFVSCSGVNPIQLAATTSIFTTTYVLIGAIIAQALPGSDNGSQVRSSPAPHKGCLPCSAACS